MTDQPETTNPPATGCPCAVGVASAQCSPRGCAPAAAPTAPPAADLRNRIVRALAAQLMPRYGGPQHNTRGGLPLTATAEEAALHRAQPLADAVLAALPTFGPCSCGGRFPLHHLHADTHEPASAPAAPAESADRRARYAAAIREESSRVDDIAISDAVMAVADAEQAGLRAELEQLRGLLWAKYGATPRRLADEAQPTETEALCGNTVGVSGLHYRPCARPAGHPEAYCRDVTGDHLFLPATAATEEPQP